MSCEAALMFDSPFVPFSGHLMGAYATTNGLEREMNAYISRWRYEAIGQQIDYKTICYYEADGYKNCKTTE